MNIPSSEQVGAPVNDNSSDMIKVDIDSDE